MLLVSGKDLLDGNGNPFRMKGINYPFAWFTDRWDTSLPAMTKYGVNTVRVVLSAGKQWEITTATQVLHIVDTLRQSNLIGVLEVHDCKGFGQPQYAPSAEPMQSAVDFWCSSEIMDALKGTEGFIILNIANEPFGNKFLSRYVPETISAIDQLRARGYTHNIMVDSPNWGQDFKRTILKNASKILAADPLKNILFSVHIYESFKDRTMMESYLRFFYEKNLPLVVGEFAMENNGIQVDAKSVLELCFKYGYGFLGWSWKGNSPGFTNLDVFLDWEGNRLTPWGELLFHGKCGILET